jgi:hypothetical protein
MPTEAARFVRNVVRTFFSIRGGTNMRDDAVSGRLPSLTIEVLRDVHFWIPVIVLLGGLVVLHWIS